MVSDVKQQGEPFTDNIKAYSQKNNALPLLWYKRGFGQLKAENDFSTQANASQGNSLAAAMTTLGR